MENNIKVQKNLVIIDYQYDFVALDGLLTCGQPAIDIEDNILKLVNEYRNENIFVTFDTHSNNDWEDGTRSVESKSFPKHCVKNTKGHNLFGKLEDVLKDVNHERIYKNSFGSNKVVESIINKNIISKDDVNKFIEVQFCGVATNVCVFQNILLLYTYFVENNIDFSIIVDKNTVASFDETLEQHSLDYLVNTLGVKVI